MNSNHENPIGTFEPRLERAKHRWPNAQISGSGRYAIAEIGSSGRTLRVVLTDDPDRQKAAELAKQLGFEHCIKSDLGYGEALLDRIPDRHWERERRARS